jgi:hypothetical protein
VTVWFDRELLSAGAYGFTELSVADAKVARDLRWIDGYQAWSALQCGQRTVVETDAANTNPQEHV